MIKIHWLIKYYVVAFSLILLIAFLIEKAQPKVNWSFYDKNLEKMINQAVLKKNCYVLRREYTKELDLNFKKNIFGIYVRKDRNLNSGQNLHRYLKYHINKINC